MRTSSGVETFGTALRRLSVELPKLGGDTAAGRLTTLRRLATAEGLHPAAMLADDLAAMMRADRGEVPVACWLDALAVAAECGAGDQRTVPLLRAMIGVRLAG